MNSSQAKIPARVFNLVSYEISKCLTLVRNPLLQTHNGKSDNPQDREIAAITIEIYDKAIVEYQQFLKDFGET